MSTGQIIQTVLMGLVFIAWAGLMFRTIFLWRRRAQDETGQALHGPAQVLKQAGKWMRSPEDKSERGTLMFMTFVLLIMAVTTATLG
jgi:hypothetical protein